MLVLCIILSIGLGYGISCFLFATLLERSNDIGNTIGEASRYTVGISYNNTRNEMKADEAEKFGTWYITDEDRKLAMPPEEGQVRQSPQGQRNIGWNSRFTR